MLVWISKIYWIQVPVLFAGMDAEGPMCGPVCWSDWEHAGDAAFPQWVCLFRSITGLVFPSGSKWCVLPRGGPSSSGLVDVLRLDMVKLTSCLFEAHRTTSAVQTYYARIAMPDTTGLGLAGIGLPRNGQGWCQRGLSGAAYMAVPWSVWECQVFRVRG